MKKYYQILFKHSAGYLTWVTSAVDSQSAIARAKEELETDGVMFEGLTPVIVRLVKD